ncbi:MAG TPA: ADOP family duplicated permease [Thermoanaerobaculia bacterium]|nr:ADOP family duplicated permease [Thermoanaerobaculia bacterium]
MTALLQDLRYALRSLAKSPGFAGAAILILALGIGANTALFSLVDAVVLHPLPGVAHPESLVDVTGQVVSYPWYRSVRDETSGAFDGLAAWRQRALSLSTDDGAQPALGAVVSGNYFAVLGARPALGRLLQPADETSGEAVAVMNGALWRSRFGADPAIVGKAVRLNGAPVTIVGVSADGFRGTAFGVAPDFWIPIGAWPKLAAGNFHGLNLESRGWAWLSLFGRVRPGAATSHAQAALDLARRHEAAAHPDDLLDGPGLVLQPTLRGAAGYGQSGNPVGFLFLLVSAVAVALAIACANLANLLLARAAARQKEIAVRQALGATRGRLVRQLLTESVLLAALGGGAGVLLAAWAIGALARVPLPGDVTLATFAPALDGRVLGFAAGLSAAAALAFGLLPAVQAARRPASFGLKAGAATLSATRARGAFLIAQVSLCLVLLLGAGLLGRSLQRALASDVGFQPRGLTLASFQLGLQRYEAPRAAAFLRDLRQDVASAPGVGAAAWMALPPLSGGQWSETFQIEGAPATTPLPEVSINVVGMDFFRTLQIPIAAGREFRDDLDREGAPGVAVINEAMARRYFGSESPIGRRIDVARAVHTIVGVCRDFRSESLRDAPIPQVYLPLAQTTDQSLGGLALAVRGPSEGASAERIRRAVRKLDASVAIFELASYDELLGGQLLAQRLGSALLGLFGLLSLVLAAVGIYAVVAYSVERRTREIGIRVALGARAADVKALVLAQSAKPLVWGLALGLALGAAAARLLRGFLFGISAWDPPTFAGVAAVLGLCALAAAWLPARRAARVDPMIALRSE